jgi:hypothetical protein
MFRRFFLKPQRKALFTEVERFGNIRLDRITFTLHHGEKPRWAFRLTGRMNPAWVCAAIRASSKDWKDGPDTKDRDAVTLEGGDDCLLLAGTTDVVFSDRAGVVAALKARAAKAAGASGWPRLKEVPADAVGGIVGVLAPGKTGLKGSAWLTRTKAALALRADMRFGDESTAEEVDSTFRSFRDKFDETFQTLVLARVLGLGEEMKALPEADGKAVVAAVRKMSSEVRENRWTLKAELPHDGWLLMVGLFGVLDDPFDKFLKDRKKGDPLLDKRPR